MQHLTNSSIPCKRAYNPSYLGFPLFGKEAILRTVKEAILLRSGCRHRTKWKQLRPKRNYKVYSTIYTYINLVVIFTPTYKARSSYNVLQLASNQQRGHTFTIDLEI